MPKSKKKDQDILQEIRPLKKARSAPPEPENLPPARTPEPLAIPQQQPQCTHDQLLRDLATNGYFCPRCTAVMAYTRPQIVFVMPNPKEEVKDVKT